MLSSLPYRKSLFLLLLAGIVHFIGFPIEVAAAPKVTWVRTKLDKVELVGETFGKLELACFKRRARVGRVQKKSWFRHRALTAADVKRKQGKKSRGKNVKAKQQLKDYQRACRSGSDPQPAPTPSPLPSPTPISPSNPIVPPPTNDPAPSPNIPAPEYPALQPIPQINPISLDNSKSGISISLSGTNGSNWATENSFHDSSIGDQIIYLHSDTEIALEHNERNSLMKRDGTVIPAILGIGGIDGVPHNGDEGNIHFKIDRDMQSHLYSTKGTQTIPFFAPKYSSPFSLDELTYDGTTPVVGSVGDNGLPWGSSAHNTTSRFGYGQIDPNGNECHTLTYWDDDEPLFKMVNEDSHRQGASDGHWVYLCIDPVVPVLQFAAPEGEQFYTTPLKTYHIPKTWEQTTYLTAGVTLNFVNLTNEQPVYFRINGGSWQQFSTANVKLSQYITSTNQPVLLEYQAGQNGAIGKRQIVLAPEHPSSNEVKGFMLARDANDFAQIVWRLNNLQPFKKSYEIFNNSFYQGTGAVFTDTRGGWRSQSGSASTSLSNAFSAAVSGLNSKLQNAVLAKTRLLRLARLEPVGNELSVSSATPSKDYLSELGQTIQVFADAGVAYDLLAAHFKDSDHPLGMTPIEELRIRDGLAEIAKTILQFRDNWSYISGGGDTHWAYGFELAVGTIALAMPSYKTPYFGVSGGDMVSVNDLADENGKFFNPFPDQGVTWYQAATDPEINRPGYPNIAAPPRAEFLMSDDGYWTGANYMDGDGSRYVTGPLGNRLVGVTSNGLANAEVRTEIIEMDGYEAPFSTRAQVLDFARRVKGDYQQQPAISTYIQRRAMFGFRQLSWDGNLKRYNVLPARAVGSIYSFNKEYDFAGTSSAKNLMSEFISQINRYYGFEAGSYPAHIEQDRKALYDAYGLALFAHPSEVAGVSLANQSAPIIKHLHKYVVKPGETVFKEIIAFDLDDSALTVSVSVLPAGATYNSTTRTITWTPTAQQEGVYTPVVTASDGASTTSRPFPIIVKANAGSGPVPAKPGNVTVALGAGDMAQLSWTHPAGVNIARYIIYRDGAIRDVISGNQTSYVDTQPLPAGSHTRYHVALFSTAGGESTEAATQPSIISVPR